MSDLRALGADISHHQKRFEFLGNLDFVILRATFGIHEDSRFRNFLPEAMKVPVRGAYHYLVSFEPLEKQLQAFRAAVAAGEFHFLALDFEQAFNTFSRDFALLALRGLDTLAATAGTPVLLYTNPNNWNTGLRPFLTPDELAQVAAFELWVAQWPNVSDEAAVRTTQPPFLAPAMQHWTFWQFNADLPSHPDRGPEFGVLSPKIDLDVFNGTEAALQQRFLGQEIPVETRPSGRVPIDVSPAGGMESPAGPPPAPGLLNQNIINVYFRAARALGMVGDDLMARAGLDLMAMVRPESNRFIAYTGPTIEAVTGISEAERAALRTALAFELTLPPLKVPAAQSSGPAAAGGPAPTFITWEHRAVAGLHGPADPGGGWVPEAFDVVQRTKVRAVKVLVPDVQVGEVARLKEINPGMFVVARLFSGQLHEQRPQGGDGTPEAAGRWFANEVADPGDANSPMKRAVAAGIEFFEVHNEPNLTTEGLGVNWQDGAGFARFFRTVVDTLRPRFPGAKFGFPGLSPGAVVPPRLIGVAAFLQQAREAVAVADFLCCHVYWGQEGVDLQGALNQLREICAMFPQKRIVCSEFSNNNPGERREVKAAQYAQFYRACRELPSNLGAMFAYALSWRNDRNREGFLELTEDEQSWRMTGMAEALGAAVEG